MATMWMLTPARTQIVVMNVLLHQRLYFFLQFGMNFLVIGILFATAASLSLVSVRVFFTMSGHGLVARNVVGDCVFDKVVFLENVCIVMRVLEPQDGFFCCFHGLGPSVSLLQFVQHYVKSNLKS